MENARTKADRREAVYQAIEALNTEIEQRLEAVRALEVVYFGRQITGELELIPKPAPEAKKRPRGSKPRKRKKAAKGKARAKKTRRKLSQTPAAKAARAYREKKAAEAAKAAPAGPAKKPPAAARTPGKAHSAHDTLKAHREREIDKETASRPGNALVDRKAPALSSQGAARPPASSRTNNRKPSLPPVKKGSLTGLTQRAAIKAVLRKASRQLSQPEILDRLLVGGYQFRSENPKSALSVALATMRGELQTETRAGRLWYDPITGGELERGNG